MKKSYYKINPIYMIGLLIIGLFLVIIWKANKNEISTVDIQHDVKEIGFSDKYMGVSQYNGLYYSIDKDAQFSIVETYYGDALLGILGTKFSDTTYDRVENYIKDVIYGYSDVDDIIEANYYAYCILKDNSKLDEEQLRKAISNEMKKLMHYDWDDMDYVHLYYTTCLMSSYDKIDKEEKIKKWIIKKIEEYEESSIINEVYLLMSALNLNVDITKIEFKIDNEEINKNLQILKTQQKFEENDIYKIESISNLYKLDLIAVDKEIINTINGKMNDLLNDASTNIEMMKRIVTVINGFEGKVLNRENLIGKIKGKELDDGGLSSTQYIGTAKETLMMLAVNKFIDDDIIEATKVYLDKIIEEYDKDKTDSCEIYSALCILNYEGEDITSYKEKIILKFRERIKDSLTNKNWREWFYQIMAMELLGYDFKESDYPNNIENIKSEISDKEFISFTDDDDSNCMINLMIFDAMCSMEENDYIKKYASEYVYTQCKCEASDVLFLKKRYYGTIVAKRIGLDVDIAEVLSSVGDLQCEYGYKVSIEYLKPDIQSTFQVANLDFLEQGGNIDEMFR